MTQNKNTRVKPIIHLHPVGQPRSFQTACGQSIARLRGEDLSVTSVVREATCQACFNTTRG